MKQDEKRYTIEVTEHQLHLISQCVEDCHRFMAGDYELNHMTSRLDRGRELLNELRNLKPLITPSLPDPRSCYDWSGATCPNKHQRKFIAETYCIYREILHFLTLETHNHESVYASSTLTCSESGPLPIIKPVKP